MSFNIILGTKISLFRSISCMVGFKPSITKAKKLPLVNSEFFAHEIEADLFAVLRFTPYILTEAADYNTHARFLR